MFQDNNPPFLCHNLHRRRTSLDRWISRAVAQLVCILGGLLWQTTSAAVTTNNNEDDDNTVLLVGWSLYYVVILVFPYDVLTTWLEETILPMAVAALHQLRTQMTDGTIAMQRSFRYLSHGGRILVRQWRIAV